MRREIVVAAVCVASAAASAQQPTFRSEVALVQVPVRVLDSRGNFIRDLGQQDFQIVEDGTPQVISTFKLVEYPLPGSAAARAGGGPPATSATGLSNDALEQLDGRLYMLLVDDNHISIAHTPRAKDVIQRFVRDWMGPGDAAAMVFASGARRQDFTRDKTQLLRTADQLKGVLDTNEPASVRESKARSVVTLFSDLAKALGQIEERHKAIIYIGAGVGCRISPETHPDPQKPLQQGGGSRFADLSSAGTAAPSDASQQILCSDPTWDAVRALVQHNTTVYAIDPRGTLNPGWVSPTVDGRGGPGPARQRMAIAEPGRPALSDGFHVISDQTGGFAVTDTNGFNQALGRIVRENSAYYLIGYVSTNDKPDGKYRKTTITVSRPGVELFYRTGYMARRD